MSNLERVNAKIFAGDAPTESIGQFGSALAGTKYNTTDVAEIQALEAYEQGWQDAVLTEKNYPTLEEMNGVFKTLSYQIAYLLQKGVPEWDSAATYYTGDVCKSTSGTSLYFSQSDDNTNHPLSQTQYWKKVDLWSNPMTAVGDIIVGGTNGSAQRLAAGSNGQVLMVNNGVPQYGAIEIMPDYSAGVSKSVNTTYTAEVNGYLKYYSQASTPGNVSSKLIINDNTITSSTADIYIPNGGGNFWQDIGVIPVSAGDTYKLEGGSSLIFYPCKGV